MSMNTVLESVRTNLIFHHDSIGWGKNTSLLRGFEDWTIWNLTFCSSKKKKVFLSWYVCIRAYCKVLVTMWKKLSGWDGNYILGLKYLFPLTIFRNTCIRFIFLCDFHLQARKSFWTNMFCFLLVFLSIVTIFLFQKKLNKIRNSEMS